MLSIVEYDLIITYCSDRHLVLLSTIHTYVRKITRVLDPIASLCLQVLIAC